MINSFNLPPIIYLMIIPCFSYNAILMVMMSECPVIRFQALPYRENEESNATMLMHAKILDTDWSFQFPVYRATLRPAS